jgi:hypothetical protein
MSEHSSSRRIRRKSSELRGFFAHARVRVEQRKLAIGDQVPHDEGPLADASKPFSPLQIGQLRPFCDRQSKHVSRMWRLGRLLLVDDLG